MRHRLLPVTGSDVGAASEMSRERGSEESSQLAD